MKTGFFPDISILFSNKTKIVFYIRDGSDLESSTLTLNNQNIFRKIYILQKITEHF